MIHPGNFPYQNIRTFEFSPSDKIRRDAFMPDVIDLRNKKIIRLDVHDGRGLDYAPSGKQALSFAESYISFMDEFGKYIYDHVSNQVFNPLDNMHYRKLISKTIAFPKSFISNGRPDIYFNELKSFVLTAFFNDKPLRSIENKKPILIRTLEIPLTSDNKSVYPFNSNDTKIFVGKKIRYISWYKPNTSGIVPADCITPKDNIATEIVSGAYLNLVDDTGKTVVSQYPVVSLQAFYQKMTDRITLDDLSIDWEKSNIQYAPNSTQDVGKSIVLNVYYTE